MAQETGSDDVRDGTPMDLGIHGEDVIVTPHSATTSELMSEMGEDVVSDYIQTTLDVEEMEKLHREQGIIKEDVLNHILFHKALIDDDQDSPDIDYDKYINMVNELQKGYHLTMSNPYDMSIAISFELVIEQKLNPWDIDLRRFTRLYLKHANKQDELDLITAGKIIFMAWAILRIKSEDVLFRAEQEPEEDEFFDDGMWDFISDDEDFEFTKEVLTAEDPPIKEMVWRKGKRPVTLLELVGAFEEAREESIKLKEINKRRLELVQNNMKLRKKNVREKLHRDSQEEDIRLVWERIMTFNGTAIPMSDLLWEGDRDDIILVVRAILFLAQRRWVKIRQKNFPYGEVYVTNIFDPEKSMIPDTIKNDPDAYQVLFGGLEGLPKGMVITAKASQQQAGGVDIEPHEMGLNT